jgi:hypothetical protein
VLTAFLAAAGACLAQSAPEAAREPLFNGRDLAGWRAYRQGRWEVIDGAIHGILEGKGGCWLLTERELGDAKLCLSYSLPEKGNGGICVRFPRDEGQRRRQEGKPIDNPAFGGYEVQILDDHGLCNPTGSIYELAPAYTREYGGKERPFWRAGGWNDFEIIALRDWLRVTLNGRVVNDVFHPGPVRGTVGIQLHGSNDQISVKDIKAAELQPPREALDRVLPPEPLADRLSKASGAWEPLFDGKTLDGWQVLWGGVWTVEDGAIAGRWDPQQERPGSSLKPHGWLLTAREYGDFALRLSFKVDRGGNSGVCVRYPRARFLQDPAFAGYEIQIWDVAGEAAEFPTGCVYALARAYNGLARPEAWNELEVFCRGPRITVLVNGSRAADCLDLGRLDPRTGEPSPGPRSLHGFVGLQIHDRGKTVRFKDIAIKEIAGQEEEVAAWTALWGHVKDR